MRVRGAIRHDSPTATRYALWLPSESPNGHGFSSQPFERTPLNIATDARHAACIASGGHVPSEVTLTRGEREYAVCSACSVPLPVAKGWKAVDVNREAGRRGAAARQRARRAA